MKQSEYSTADLGAESPMMDAFFTLAEALNSIAQTKRETQTRRAMSCFTQEEISYIHMKPSVPETEKIGPAFAGISNRRFMNEVRS